MEKDLGQINKTMGVKKASATSYEGLSKLEAKYRRSATVEILPFAKDTGYEEIAKNVIPDKETDQKNPSNERFKNKLYVIVSEHLATLGIRNLLVKVNEYLNILKEKNDMDILSISGGMKDNRLFQVSLVRIYGNDILLPDFDGLYAFLGESAISVHGLSKRKGTVEKKEKIVYSKEEKEEHKRLLKEQHAVLEKASNEGPFLNAIEHYTREVLPSFEDEPSMYRLRGKEKRDPTILSYEAFMKIFNEAIIYITGVEKTSYENVLKGKEKKEPFMAIVEEYLTRVFIFDRKVLPPEDLGVMLSEMHRALFELYIVQDLINDDEITDIKITDPYTVRVRIKGRAYLSDVTFVNEDDYLRFVKSLIIRNNIDSSVPEQTFSDENDPNYKLRFTITMPYISSNRLPVLHIRKTPRKKLMSEDLIKAGMMDEKIRDYLLDCGRNASGIVFSGAPGSGKTTILNWFLEEAYEDSAEILVIQENDELFSYRKGIVFQQVVLNPPSGQRPCSLEDLGQLALVAGANVFVIGEVKGAEVCSAVTLANSGCRTAVTVHSRSAVETIDKMADLAMRGYATTYEQAKRMMKCFEIIVYLEDFKVKEISEVIGYDEETKDMIYRPIYKLQN